MAKVEKKQSRSRVKLRFVELEVDGDDASLLEGLRSFAAALSRGQASGQPPRALGTRPASIDDDFEAAAVDAIEAGNDEDDDAEGRNDAAGAEERATKPRKVRTPEAAAIDLLNPAPSFQVFADPFDTKQNPDRALIAASWMRDHRDVAAFGAGHLYSCFKAMKKWSPQPKDYFQLLQDMARKSQTIVKTPKGDYKLTHLGENRLAELKTLK